MYRDADANYAIPGFEVGDARFANHYAGIQGSRGRNQSEIHKSYTKTQLDYMTELPKNDFSVSMGVQRGDFDNDRKVRTGKSVPTGESLHRAGKASYEVGARSARDIFLQAPVAKVWDGNYTTWDKAPAKITNSGAPSNKVLREQHAAGDMRGKFKICRETDPFLGYFGKRNRGINQTDQIHIPFSNAYAPSPSGYQEWRSQENTGGRMSAEYDISRGNPGGLNDHESVDLQRHLGHGTVAGERASAPYGRDLDPRARISREIYSNFKTRKAKSPGKGSRPNDLPAGWSTHDVEERGRQRRVPRSSKRRSASEGGYFYDKELYPERLGRPTRDYQLKYRFNASSNDYGKMKPAVIHREGGPVYKEDSRKNDDGASAVSSAGVEKHRAAGVITALQDRVRHERGIHLNAFGEAARRAVYSSDPKTQRKPEDLAKAANEVVAQQGSYLLPVGEDGLRFLPNEEARGNEGRVKSYGSPSCRKQPDAICRYEPAENFPSEQPTFAEIKKLAPHYHGDYDSNLVNPALGEALTKGCPSDDPSMAGGGPKKLGLGRNRGSGEYLHGMGDNVIEVDRGIRGARGKRTYATREPRDYYDILSHNLRPLNPNDSLFQMKNSIRKGGINMIEGMYAAEEGGRYADHLFEESPYYRIKPKIRTPHGATMKQEWLQEKRERGFETSQIDYNHHSETPNGPSYLQGYASANQRPPGSTDYEDEDQLKFRTKNPKNDIRQNHQNDAHVTNRRLNVSSGYRRHPACEAPSSRSERSTRSNYGSAASRSTQSSLNPVAAHATGTYQIKSSPADERTVERKRSERRYPRQVPRMLPSDADSTGYQNSKPYSSQLTSHGLENEQASYDDEPGRDSMDADLRAYKQRDAVNNHQDDCQQGEEGNFQEDYGREDYDDYAQDEHDHYAEEGGYVRDISPSTRFARMARIQKEDALRPPRAAPRASRHRVSAKQAEHRRGTAPARQGTAPATETGSHPLSASQSLDARPSDFANTNEHRSDLNSLGKNENAPIQARNYVKEDKKGNPVDDRQLVFYNSANEMSSEQSYTSSGRAPARPKHYPPAKGQAHGGAAPRFAPQSRVNHDLSEYTPTSQRSGSSKMSTRTGSSRYSGRASSARRYNHALQRAHIDQQLDQGLDRFENRGLDVHQHMIDGDEDSVFNQPINRVVKRKAAVQNRRRSTDAIRKAQNMATSTGFVDCLYPEKFAQARAPPQPNDSPRVKAHLQKVQQRQHAENMRAARDNMEGKELYNYLRAKHQRQK